MIWKDSYWRHSTNDRNGFQDERTAGKWHYEASLDEICCSFDIINQLVGEGLIVRAK